jgi:hypothetical protein
MRKFRIGKKTEVIFTHPWRGGGFFWRDFRFNRGNSYLAYRIGPVIVREYL